MKPRTNTKRPLSASGTLSRGSRGNQLDFPRCRYIIAAFIPGDSELSYDRAWKSNRMLSFPGDHMAFSLFASIAPYLKSYGHKAVLAAGLAVFSAAALQSKDAPLIAIELYNGSNGPAYVHITDLLINGKIEFLHCHSTPKIDKSTYWKLPKVFLGTGASIEYGKDETLILTRTPSSSSLFPTTLN